MEAIETIYRPARAAIRGGERAAVLLAASGPPAQYLCRPDNGGGGTVWVAARDLEFLRGSPPEVPPADAPFARVTRGDREAVHRMGESDARAFRSAGYSVEFLP